MSDIPIASSKKFDLEDRTTAFAKKVRKFVRKLPRSAANSSDSEQLIRSSGSVGANYIEANEALGKNDFGMHIRISLKEAKESKYWLELLNVENNAILDNERVILQNEAYEFVKIFCAILHKSQKKTYREF